MRSRPCSAPLRSRTVQTWCGSGRANSLDDATAKLMADKGLWRSLQPFLDDRPSPFAAVSPNRRKQLEMFAGTDAARSFVVIMKDGQIYKNILP